MTDNISDFKNALEDCDLGPDDGVPTYPWWEDLPPMLKSKVVMIQGTPMMALPRPKIVLPFEIIDAHEYDPSLIDDPD